MAITIVTGVMGAGKSYYACRWLFVSGHKQTTLVTNMKLNRLPKNVKDYFFVEDFAGYDFEKLRDCVLLIDEANKVFPSRQWEKNKFEFLTFTRKLNIEVLLLTQHVSQLDKQIRDLAQFVVYLRNFERVPIIGRAFKFLRVATMFEGKTRVNVDVFVLGEFYDVYDTFQTRSAYAPGGSSPDGRRVKSKSMSLAFVFVLLLGGVGVLMTARGCADKKAPPFSFGVTDKQKFLMGGVNRGEVVPDRGTPAFLGVFGGDASANTGGVNRELVIVGFDSLNLYVAPADFGPVIRPCVIQKGLLARDITLLDLGAPLASVGLLDQSLTASYLLSAELLRSLGFAGVVDEPGVRGAGGFEGGAEPSLGQRGVLSVGGGAGSQATDILH